MATRIIATGGHSGLGFEALKTLLASPSLASSCSLTLLVRDPAAAPVVRARHRLVEQFRAARQASATPQIPSDELCLKIKPMDLASLASVRKAASALNQELQQRPIVGTDEPASGVDILLLNAAVAKSNRELVIDEDRVSGAVQYASDQLVDREGRIETTACVNHVAHLVLISMLAPTIAHNAKNGRRTRIVFTGSALHRSLKHLDVLDRSFATSSRETAQDSPWTLRETYAASKFLQMLGVRALRRRLEDSFRSLDVPAGSVQVVVVQPGFVPQTALARESGLLTRLAMSYILPWAPFTTSLEDAGMYIASACTADLRSPGDTTRTEAQGQPDGFHSNDALVPSALLEVHAKSQRFATLDSRTADIELQDKWWPAACNAAS